MLGDAGSDSSSESRSPDAAYKFLAKPREIYREPARATDANGDLLGRRVAVAAEPYAEEISVDGRPWNPVDPVGPWTSLSEDEIRLF